MTLPIHTQFLQLTFTRGGRLLPWLGPALRGIVAGTLKNRVCRQPPIQRELQWKFCRGCPHNQECAYGLTYEPEPPDDRTVLKAAADGQRAVTLTPYFPAPLEGHAGDRLQVRLLLLGQRAIGAASAVVDAMAEAGKTKGFGQDEIAFQVQPTHVPSWPAGQVNLRPMDLGRQYDPSLGVLPWVRLELTSPLFLKEGAQGQAGQPVRNPGFDHLLRASLRVVGRAFAVFGEGCLEEQVDFAGLKAAAERVSTQTAAWEPFRQSHHSRRGRSRYELTGLTGNAVFTDVPVSMLPWLVWGGRLGVGEHRVAGAGTWHLLVL